MWFNKKSILVIDDDKSILALVKNRLKIHDNYSVLLSEDANSGLVIAKKEKPNLIILDWMMPGLDGIQALQILKNHDELKKIPVIMLTGNKLVGEVEQAFSSGADAYLTKPLDLEKLSNKVSELIH